MQHLAVKILFAVVALSGRLIAADSENTNQAAVAAEPPLKASFTARDAEHTRGER